VGSAASEAKSAATRVRWREEVGEDGRPRWNAEWYGPGIRASAVVLLAELTGEETVARGWNVARLCAALAERCM
jgi:hypothetical protein